MVDPNWPSKLSRTACWYCLCFIESDRSLLYLQHFAAVYFIFSYCPLSCVHIDARSHATPWVGLVLMTQLMTVFSTSWAMDTSYNLFMTNYSVGKPWMTSLIWSCWIRPGLLCLSLSDSFLAIHSLIAHVASGISVCKAWGEPTKNQCHKSI